ncbi:MAG: glutathione S-transferase [Geitlerinemataceae cyanobacterium]
MRTIEIAFPMACFGLSLGLVLGVCTQAIALPPPEEIPEEILRTEIITEARSPIDGTSLTAAQYAQLQEQLQTSPSPPSVSPDIEQTVFLLRLLKFFRTLLPFL